jgi:hypothetical protein
MTASAPKLIAINHDDYHAEHVGHLPDGRQFFLTNPFDPALGKNPGCEFVALYIFNAAGDLLEDRIDSFGPRSSMDDAARRRLYDQRLKEIGPATFGRIEIAPFSIHKFGLDFGLIPREPEEDDDQWAVEIQPGNYMAFFEPWDSGDYDT